MNTYEFHFLDLKFTRTFKKSFEFSFDFCNFVWFGDSVGKFRQGSLIKLKRTKKGFEWDMMYLKMFKN